MPSGSSRFFSLRPRERSVSASASFVEAKNASCLPSPSHSGRPTPRATNIVSVRRWSNHAVAIEPLSSSNASRERPYSSTSAKIASVSTVISGSWRSNPCREKISSSFRMIPLWTPITAPCRTGWLLAAIRG